MNVFCPTCGYRGQAELKDKCPNCHYVGLKESSAPVIPKRKDLKREEIEEEDI